VLAGFTTGVASATRLAFSSNSFRIGFPTAGEPTEPFTVSCPFTLEGTFHSRTISKVNGSLVGSINVARPAEASCRNGRGMFLTRTLPWHVRYNSFTGTLPNIATATLQIVGLAVLWEYTQVPGISCLYVTTAAEPTRVILTREGGAVITSARFDETAEIRKFSGSELCPAKKATFGSTEFVTGRGERITLTLVA
jgi:hypothetical protein